MTLMIFIVVLAVGIVLAGVLVVLRQQRERRHRSMISPSPHVTLTPRAERDAGSALRLLDDEGSARTPRRVAPAKLPQEPARVIGEEAESDSWLTPSGRHNSQWALERSLTRSRVTWPVITVAVGVGIVIAILIVAGLIMGHHVTKP
jgi:uncharacterized membrane protein YidH (DUF202 family)